MLKSSQKGLFLLVSTFFLVTLSSIQTTGNFEEANAEKPSKWTNAGYVACRAGVMAACGSLVAAGVVASGGSGGIVAGAIFAACNAGGGQYICDHALPPDQRDQYTILQGACKAGSAAACDALAEFLCSGTGLGPVCSLPVGEICEEIGDELVCEVIKDQRPPANFPPENSPIDCDIRSHPLCQPSEPPAEVCGDGIDNDADGQIDEDCQEICGNGFDDNDNGLVDEGCPPVDCVVGFGPYCIRTDLSCQDFAFNHLCIREGETDSFSVRCAPYPYTGPTSDACPLITCAPYPYTGPTSDACPGSTYSISAGIGTWTWTNAGPPGLYDVTIQHPCCGGGTLHTLVSVR